MSKLNFFFAIIILAVFTSCNQKSPSNADSSTIDSTSKPVITTEVKRAETGVPNANDSFEDGNFDPTQNIQNTPATIENHYIGELFGGGIVFKVNQDGHGLIVSLTDQSIKDSSYTKADGSGGYINGMEWSNNHYKAVGSNTDKTDGLPNTSAIINQDGHTNSAALLCKNYNGGGFTDWYLPSLSEWRALILRSTFKKVNSVLESTPNASIVNQRSYWTSTEDDNWHAWYVLVLNFGGDTRVGEKRDALQVRAIRAF